jgi:hypothetical protein
MQVLHAMLWHWEPYVRACPSFAASLGLFTCRWRISSSGTARRYVRQAPAMHVRKYTTPSPRIRISSSWPVRPCPDGVARDHGDNMHAKLQMTHALTPIPPASPPSRSAKTTPQIHRSRIASHEVRFWLVDIDTDLSLGAKLPAPAARDVRGRRTR